MHSNGFNDSTRVIHHTTTHRNHKNYNATSTGATQPHHNNTTHSEQHISTDVQSTGNGTTKTIHHQHDAILKKDSVR